MKILEGQSVSDIASITHDSKVLLFGTSVDGVVYYSIKRSGFEDTAVENGEEQFGCEPWRKLPLDKSIPDPSVVAREKQTLSDKDGRVLVESIFNDDPDIQSTTGPVRLISALGHLYVLRLSVGRILLSRFVLDGMTNCLVPKLDVRFRRSKRKHEPLEPQPNKPPSDSLDYRSIDDEVFYEPAQCLSFIEDVGDFAAVFTPTNEAERNRFHFFVTSKQPEQPIRIYSFGSGRDGLIDVQDVLLSIDDPKNPGTKKYRSVNGIIEQKVTLTGGDYRSITATTYALQRERFTQDGPVLDRDAMRVMVVMKDEKTSEASALDFAVAADGTLSRLEDTPDATTLLRSVSSEVITPITLLDDIREYAASESPPGDQIVATVRGADDQLRVRSANPVPSSLKPKASVELRGTQSYDGRYKVLAADAESFEIEAALPDNSMGSWEEKRELETGLVFDNMVVGTEKASDGKLRVLSSSHDLKVGDEVQLTGTQAYDGVYPISSIADDRSYFEVDTPFMTGHTANLSRVIRRGLRMDGNDLVKTPDLELLPPVPGRRLERTVSVWVKPSETTGYQRIVADSRHLDLYFTIKNNQIAFWVGDNNSLRQWFVKSAAPALNRWAHLAANFTTYEGKVQMRLYRDGAQVDSASGDFGPSWCPHGKIPPARHSAKVSTAFQFDHPGDHICVENVPDLDRAFTLSVWVRSKGETWASDSNIVGKPGVFQISSVAGTRMLRFKIWRGSEVQWKEITFVNPERWAHCTMMYDGTSLNVYVNGITQKVPDHALPSSDNPKTSLLFADTTHSANFELAGVQLWSSALSADEVMARQEKRPEASENLVGYWPLDQDARDHSPSGGRYHGRVVGQPSVVKLPSIWEIGHKFKGEMADLQIWDRALSDDEIKTTMYANLTGREQGLVAYYRMGAIVSANETRYIPDFTPKRRDAIVEGDPYAGARNLLRENSKQQRVVKYVNDQLLAVSEGARYQETFEFKVTPNKDPNNIDGRESPIFSFAYWGQSSRSSNAKVTIDAENVEQVAFEPLEGGWYRAQCTVLIPKGISVLRAFGLSDVCGDFDSIDIRKHSLKLVSDTVTMTSYAHTLSPHSFPGSSPAMAEKLDTVTNSELKAAEHEAEINDLLERQRLLNNKSAYTNEKNALTQEIEDLDAEIEKQEKYIKDWSADVLKRYRHKFRCCNSGLVFDGSAGPGGFIRLARERAGANSQYWYIVSHGGHVVIYSDSDSARNHCIALTDNMTVRLLSIGTGIKEGMRWVCEYPPKTRTNIFNAYDVYAQLAPYDGEKLCIRRYLTTPEDMREWIIVEKTEEITSASKHYIAMANEQLAAKKAERDLKRTRLKWLQSALSSAGTQNSLNQKLTAARNKLNAELTKLATANTAFLNTLVTAPPARMPVIATDARDLSTSAAVLGFAKASGKFSLTESCEGNLLLSYIDADCSLRYAVYDATADSRNATFEQWLPETYRACPNVRDVGDKIKLDNPVELPEKAWTVDAWVHFPVATPHNSSPINVVVGHEVDHSSGRVTGLLAIRDRHRLGMIVNGFFFDCGSDLKDKLKSGWHHLAATNLGGLVTFYLDGERVGACSVSETAIFLGVGESLEVEAHPGPASAVTVFAWISCYSEVWDDDGVLIAQDGLYKLSCEGNTRSVKFGVCVNNSWKYVSFTPEDVKGWHLYTASYDGMVMQLYIDGVPVKETSCSGSMSGASKVLSIGDTQLQISVANVTVLHRACNLNEIRSALVRPNPSDDRCEGAWQMKLTTSESETLVPDASQHGRHARFKGPTPSQQNISTANIKSIRYLGNSASGQNPTGKLAHVRVWGQCLTDEEIEAQYCTPCSGKESGLLAWWPLDEGTGTTVRERSGAVAAVDGSLDGVGWVACSGVFGRQSSSVLSLHNAQIYDDKAPTIRESFTVECWCRITQPTDCTILSLLVGRTHAKIWFEGKYLCASFNSVSALVEFRPSGSDWYHLCLVYHHENNNLLLYVDGVSKATKSVREPGYKNGGNLMIGSSKFVGSICEVRVWKSARSHESILANMRKRARGVEPDLIACYPLTTIGSGDTVQDLVSGAWNGRIRGGSSTSRIERNAPVGGDGNVVTAEYSTTELGSDGVARALMRRFHAFNIGGGVTVLPEKRIEELSLEWVGNTQIKPTLLGYIEGAPPVPSENLTVPKHEEHDGYSGATTVTLTQADELTYSWQKGEGRGVAVDLSFGGGLVWAAEVGWGITTKVSEGHVLLAGTYSYEKSRSKESTISATSGLTSTDSLTLHGMFEDSVGVPRLGRRWLPKNVGYALVISGMADVFAMRLKRSRRVVGHEVRPIDGIPLDVNTITFMINPAYTLNGSLDGMVGSSPADPKLYAHVPQLRAQYGALYPASYMRLKEAYKLKDEIARLDEERSAFFYNFKAKNLDKLDNFGVPDAPQTPIANSSKNNEQTEEEQAKRDIDNKHAAAEKELKEREDLIEKRSGGANAMLRAGAAFADWQGRMEQIQLRAGKRNIANTYVWDGDGGLRAEEENFAGTIEHSMSTEEVHSGQGGIDVEAMYKGAMGYLSLMAGGSETHSYGKTLTKSQALSLNVDLSGVERGGITNLQDEPLVPGEKVDRYRFMSFYLENDTRHFHDFFRYVVDPDWLMSNDEEARALRETQMSKPNPCWRVLHRVTYVERPLFKKK